MRRDGQNQEISKGQLFAFSRDSFSVSSAFSSEAGEKKRSLSHAKSAKDAEDTRKKTAKTSLLF